MSAQTILNRGHQGAHRGPKCSHARAPLQKTAAELPGLPSHTSRLSATPVTGATAKRIQKKFPTGFNPVKTACS